MTQPTFAVADIALVPVMHIVESLHHIIGKSEEKLTPKLIRKWIQDGGIVIVSMQEVDAQGNRLESWHMFSLIALEGDRFEVWDTNGYRGYFTEQEICEGIEYPGALARNKASRWPERSHDFFVSRREQSARSRNRACSIISVKTRRRPILRRAKYKRRLGHSRSPPRQLQRLSAVPPKSLLSRYRRRHPSSQSRVAAFHSS